MIQENLTEFLPQSSLLYIPLEVGLYISNLLLYQPLTKTVNSILSSFILQKYYKDHKRTWQEVFNI